MAVAPQIRWDRIGRLMLLFVLVALVGLYIRPALSYLETRGQAAAQARDAAALEREHRSLTQRKRALRDPVILEQEARKLGYVKPGERAYVVDDLPKGP